MYPPYVNGETSSNFEDLLYIWLGEAFKKETVRKISVIGSHAIWA